jgi:transposase
VNTHALESAAFASQRPRVQVSSGPLLKFFVLRRHGRPPTFCRATYRQRNVVERVVGWLKEHRRIATRFEKLASSFLAMVKLSFMRRYFRMLQQLSGST